MCVRVIFFREADFINVDYLIIETSDYSAYFRNQTPAKKHFI